MISMFINQNVLINFMLKSLGFKNWQRDSWHVNWEFDQVQDTVKTIWNAQYPRPDATFSSC